MMLPDKLDIFRRLVNSVGFDCSRECFYLRLKDIISSFNEYSHFCFIDVHNKHYPPCFHFHLADVISVRNPFESIYIDVYICFSDFPLPNVYFRLDL